MPRYGHEDRALSCTVYVQMGQSSSSSGYVAAPYYPTPHGGWISSWDSAYSKAQALVEQMSLAEKTNITAGSGYYMGPCVGNSGSAPRLGFPQLCLNDGALGVALTTNNTAFPAGITTGATWDKDLMLARGEALGAEFRGKGVNVFLGPVVGPLGRKPLGGRGWEGFGTDPVLQGWGAYQTVLGVQSQGVIATMKHLIGYEQEMYRMTDIIQQGYSSNIDDRTMHELYLWPFAEGVRAGAGAVMAAYNKVNDSSCSQNSYLINGLLKDELGFQGFIMSDWLGQYVGVASALSGLDMAMPGDTMIPLIGESYWMYELTAAALNASVPMDRLNDMATRVVAAWYQMGQDEDFPDVNFSTNTEDEDGELYPGALLSPSGQVNWYVDVQGNHSLVALQVAQDAVTLLKNNGSVLPLSNSSALFVFGTDAAVNPDGPNDCAYRACNVGTLGMGWGSGTANYPYFDDPITALETRAESVSFHNSDTFPSSVTASDASDIAIVFLTSDSGENSWTVEGNYGDRNEAEETLWYSTDALVTAAAAVYETVIVVAHTVGPINVEAWIDLPQVKAFVVAHLPGQEAGESLMNVLFGDVSPSGHLPYSITKAQTDLPATIADLEGFSLDQIDDDFTETLYIDYRYLTANNITPRYAFGAGLSYTTFSFTDLAITAVTELTEWPPAPPAKGTTPAYNTSIPDYTEAVQPSDFTTIWRYLYSWLSESDAKSAYEAGQDGSTYPYPAGYSDNQTAGPPAGGGQGGNPALFDTMFQVSVKVTNTGPTYSGKAVVQAYLTYPAGIDYDTPPIQLRDFAKTATLAPGESTTVTLEINRKALSVWDVEAQNWLIPEVGGRYTVWIGEASDLLDHACYTDTLECGAS
ncbi:hypothetical protein ASPZODRAFT_147160 [Penicilliopsis zonata CBS 506.65]|uniref:beta-glucosidase n=1 Tax=Penicilliopsis zonata CBS 506.65 TaxID=1073090 RepID=A0A1L9S5U5_9EURO|nr:hypothetical protein ASPZODRAFT_147160 [Penicilliopsis zonata CBS 506.65]OJJ42517.1 hypothetical protein ASPZODRAFT_147160 [Penicilliopsis zonata CBS 506.65]